MLKATNLAELKELDMKETKFKTMRRKSRTKFEVSGTTVPCTRQLQRRMYRNLGAAARSKVNHDGVNRADELLALIEAEHEATIAEKHTETVIAKMPAVTGPSDKETVEPVVPQIRQSPSVKLKRSVERISSFVQRSRLFQRIRRR